MDNIFGKRLLLALRSSGVTQIKLSETIGVSISTVQYWIKGRNIPSGTTIIKICNLLNTTPNYLLGFDDNMVK